MGNCISELIEYFCKRNADVLDQLLQTFVAGQMMTIITSFGRIIYSYQPELN